MLIARRERTPHCWHWRPYLVHVEGVCPKGSPADAVVCRRRIPTWRRCH